MVVEFLCWDRNLIPTAASRQFHPFGKPATSSQKSASQCSPATQSRCDTSRDETNPPDSVGPSQPSMLESLLRYRDRALAADAENKKHRLEEFHDCDRQLG